MKGEAETLCEGFARGREEGTGGEREAKRVSKESEGGGEAEEG